MKPKDNGATGADNNPQPQTVAPLVVPTVPAVAPTVGADETPFVGAPLWFAPTDEKDLLKCVVNDYDAATVVFPTFDPNAFTNDATRRLFKAARDVWHSETLLRSASLADWCNVKAATETQAANGTDSGAACEHHTAEAMLWIEAGAIAADELATAPTGATDLTKEAETIARRLSKVPRFDLATLGEVFNRPDPTFIIDRLLTAGGTSILTAKHASFKSFFALDMALCIATGRDFHGLKCERGGVVYIAAEGASGLKKRARAWLIHHGIESPPANFLVLDKPLQIANEGERTAFARAVAAQPPALIVLDTLARCGVGLDENNAKDMGAFADALALLATATGAHVLTVHHNNKNGEYRGSSALPAAVDTHLALERHKESDAATLKVEKQKDADELHPLVFEKSLITLPNTGGLGHSLVFNLLDTSAGSPFRLSDMEQKALDELQNTFGERGATSSHWQTLCDATGISKSSFLRAKSKLLSIGAVTCPDDKKRGAIYTPNLDWCQGVK